MVNSIEYNVTQTVDHVEDAHGQLRLAEHWQQKARKVKGFVTFWNHGC